jgi:hypothetical protein
VVEIVAVKQPWEKQESRLANLLGGERNAGSGNGWSRKNDVRSPRFLVEAKWTSKKSYSLKAQELRQLEHNAAMDNRIPVLCIELGGRRYVVVPEEHFPFDISDGVPR